ncbi:hypothetical protein GGF43_003126 [Coemansia sp. RSA 2618]|nr:hypothetical protein GGF43_003126 [Coemansia sp. RSA 2618]
MGDKLPRAPYAADKVPWDLKVRIMHVASALQVATSLNTTSLGHEEALRQGRAAMQLPQLEKPDPDIYSRLIGGAVRMKSEKLAERLFRELVEAGVAPPGAVYARLAEMYADRNQISRVFLIVRGMLAIHHYKITKEKLEDGTLANVSRARRKAVLARKLAMLQVDLECIVPLLRFYVQENREDETMALLQSWDMLYKDRVPTEKLVAALLKVYNRPEDTSSASSLLHTLVSRLNSERGDKDDGSEAAERESVQTAQAARGADAATILLAHSQAIQTHLRARNIPGVVQVLREILDGDLQPPYKIWEMVMRGFLQEHALDLFDTVHAFLRDTLKVPLSLPMYSLWMRSLHGHGDVGGVQAAFDEMVELGQIPTQQHYLTLVLAYAHRGLLDQAVGIVHNLRKPNSALRPGVMLEAAVVEAHAACGEMAEAEAELRRLMDTTHLPPSSIPAHPFNALIIGHLRSGHGAKAIRVYTEMMRLGVKPDVYTFSILMYSYAKAKHVKNCLRVFSEMARMGVVPTIVTYTILIFAFSTAKLFSRADKVFDHIIQEQNWARAQVESRNLFMAGGSIPSSSPDILDMYAAPSRFSQWDVGEQLTDDEHIRIRSFYNLNPVVYIVMLSMYRRSRRTMWALATWERFMKNFPIVQWNPREGGITSKTLYHTSNFHLIAWTLVLRTVTKAVRAPLLFSQPHRHVDYFTEPLHSRVIRMRLDRRQQQKLNLQYLASRWPNDGRIQDLRKRMLRRRHIVGDVEKEIDARLDADFEFCRQQRFEQRLPKLEDQLHFNGYRYWMPNYTDLARLRIIPDGRMVHATVPIPLFKKRLRPNSPPKLSTTGEPLSPLFKEKGRFVNPTVQGMASILSKQWRALEEGQFMFNNIHVSVYLPIVIVGRQYEDLIHFLLQVQPRAASRKATEDPDHPKEYRYRKIHVDPRTTRMLTRQIRIVCGMMLAERDRRVLLTALLDTDSNLHDIYTHGSTFRGPMVERTANVLRVMRERLVIHCEREISWARELDTLRYIASLWVPLIGAEPRNELKEMLEMIEEVPR